MFVSLNLVSDGERGVMARERDRLDPHGETHIHTPVHAERLVGTAILHTGNYQYAASYQYPTYPTRRDRTSGTGPEAAGALDAKCALVVVYVTEVLSRR